MSLAFILYCLWLAAAAATGVAPAEHRPVLKVAVLAAASVPVLLAAATVGWVPAVIALCGVVAVFPGPVASLGRLALGALRARLGRGARVRTPAV